MNLIYLFIGVLVGAIVLYVSVKTKLEAAQTLDEETLNKNEHLRAELLELTKEHTYLSASKDEIITNINILQQQRESITANITELKQQAENAANALYQQSYDLANEKMSQAAETMSSKYREMELAAEQEYLSTLGDCVESFQEQINMKQKELANIDVQLAELTAKFNAAVEANKRAEELREKQDFYRLQLPQIDIDEIIRLREVVPYLRDSEPLNKVIWKVYYEKPYTDLIGRVIGSGTHTGIYKITNMKNQMCYVGQAANLADRWKQHIKRGIGAEAPTRNKLYPAMLEFGVENFTFEVVEECDRSLLNEREDYWQEVFKAKEYGYSIK